MYSSDSVSEDCRFVLSRSLCGFLFNDNHFESRLIVELLTLFHFKLNLPSAFELFDYVAHIRKESTINIHSCVALNQQSAFNTALLLPNVTL